MTKCASPPWKNIQIWVIFLTFFNFWEKPPRAWVFFSWVFGLNFVLEFLFFRPPVLKQKACKWSSLRRMVFDPIPGIQWRRTLSTRSCRFLPGPLWAQRPGSHPGFCSAPPHPRLWRAAPWISSRSGRGESVGTGWRWPSCPLAALQLEWRAGALDIARCGYNLFSFSICLLSIPLPLPTSIWFRFWSFASLFRDGGRGKITDFTLTKIKCAFCKGFLYHNRSLTHL